MDKKTRLEICKLSRPGEAKRAGKRLALREDWHEVKIDIMYQVVFEKFYQNPDLRSKLIATGYLYNKDRLEHALKHLLKD